MEIKLLNEKNTETINDCCCESVTNKQHVTFIIDCTGEHFIKCLNVSHLSMTYLSKSSQSHKDEVYSVFSMDLILFQRLCEKHISLPDYQSFV